MNKRTKILASVLSSMLIVTSLAGCGKSTSTSGTTGGKLPTGQTITVWSHLNDDEVAVVKKYAEQWAQKTGNKVNVVKDNGNFQSLVTAAKSPSGPDVMYGIPHDNVGQYVEAGVAEEIPNGTIDESKYNQTAIDATKYNGKTYSVPILAETYALFYNKDMVSDSEVPKTWDDLLTEGKKVGFEMDLTNFYYAYAIMAGNGAYVFKNNNGKLDPTDIGLGGPEGVAGLTMIKNLVDQGYMKASITGDIAKGDFANKKIGLYISGAWDISGDKGFKALGINYGIAPLPSINGQPTPSFMGVQVAVVNSFSKNKALTYDLIKYLQDNAENDLVALGRMPVLKDGKLADPSLQGFADQVKNAQPMPNIPEMAAVWTPAQDAIKLLISNKLTPDAAAKNMVDGIKKGIAALK